MRRAQKRNCRRKKHQIYSTIFFLCPIKSELTASAQKVEFYQSRKRILLKTNNTQSDFMAQKGNYREHKCQNSNCIQRYKGSFIWKAQYTHLIEELPIYLNAFNTTSIEVDVLLSTDYKVNYSIHLLLKEERNMKQSTTKYTHVRLFFCIINSNENNQSSFPFILHFSFLNKQQHYISKFTC